MLCGGDVLNKTRAETRITTAGRSPANVWSTRVRNVLVWVWVWVGASAGARAGASVGAGAGADE
eukprot:12442393-Alexandrium_andersonii.AAC.1